MHRKQYSIATAAAAVTVAAVTVAAAATVAASAAEAAEAAEAVKNRKCQRPHTKNFRLLFLHTVFCPETMGIPLQL